MPTPWPLVPLGDAACAVERAVTPAPGTVYRQVGVKLWGQGAYEREPLDGAETRYKTLSRVEAGDIIVNKIWARNGSVAVIPESLDGGYVSGEFPTFVPSRGKLEPRWLHWFTKIRNCWEQCDEKSRGTSGKNRIRPELFLQIKIPLPPIDEQRRIVARIEELAARIQEARGLRHQAADEAEAILSSAIASCAAAASKTVGYKLTRVEDACEVVTDGAHNTPRYVDEGVPLLTAKNVFWDRIDGVNVRRISREEHEPIYRRCPVKRGDVLFINIGATTGTARKVDTDTEFSVKNLAMLRADPHQLDTDLLVYLLRSPTVRDQIAERQAQTCQQFLALRDIRDLKIPLPPLTEQRRIVAYLDGLQAKVDALKKLQAETAAELDALLPSILDKAFRGDL